MLLLVILLVAAGAAPDRPPATPTADVDVTYQSVVPTPKGEPRVLRQRMRWSAQAGLVRVDPPTEGLYFVMDLNAHRMWAIRDEARAVLETATPPNAPGVLAGAYVRQGSATVAGLPCTEWATADVTGAATIACITADGVVLRARSGGEILMEASSVHYGPQAASVFKIPADYRKITPKS